MTHHYIGLQLLAYGRLDDALVSIRTAQALEPLGPGDGGVPLTF
jgi:hypothetical protein